MMNEDMQIKRYDVALATRNFEIELFWKRSVFFWGFIASAFVGYAVVSQNNESLAVVISCFGFVGSVAWSLANRGSKYWHENWESIVSELEGEVTGALFEYRAPQQRKGLWLTSRKFSVSKVTIALSDFTVIIWSALMIYHLMRVLPLLTLPSPSWLIVLIICFSVIFVILMIIFGQTTDEENQA